MSDKQSVLAFINRILDSTFNSRTRSGILEFIVTFSEMSSQTNILKTVERRPLELVSLFRDGIMSVSEREEFAALLVRRPDGPLRHGVEPFRSMLEKVLTQRDSAAAPALTTRFREDNEDNYEHDPDCTCGCNELPDDYYDLIAPAEFPPSVEAASDEEFERLAEMFLHRDMALREDRVAFLKFLGYDVEGSGIELDSFEIYPDREGSRGNDYLFRLLLAFLVDDHTDDEWIAMARYFGWRTDDVDNPYNLKQTQRIIGCVKPGV